MVPLGVSPGLPDPKPQAHFTTLCALHAQVSSSSRRGMLHPQSHITGEGSWPRGREHLGLPCGWKSSWESSDPVKGVLYVGNRERTCFCSCSLCTRDYARCFTSSSAKWVFLCSSYTASQGTAWATEHINYREGRTTPETTGMRSFTAMCQTWF